MPASARRASAAIGAALVAAGCLALAGCPASSPGPSTEPAKQAEPAEKPQSKTDVGSDTAPAKPAEPPEQKAAADLALTVVDREGYRQFLEQHRGKVVLVDFWATWCTSCIDLLPHHVALQKECAGQGLVVATVSMDELADPDDPAQQAPVRQVLADKAAPLEHLLARPARPGQPDTDPFQVFGIPGGALPHLKLYDRDGKLVRTFDSKAGNIKPEAIDQAVEKLLDTP